MIRRRWAAALGIAAGAAAPAHAVDWFDRIDYACDGNNANGVEAKLKQEALTSCSMGAENAQGTPAICGVVAGTPFACHDSSVVDDARQCSGGGVQFTIKAGTGALLGWKVEGELTAIGQYKISAGGGRCELEPKIPPPTGAGGTFIKRRGWVRNELKFVARGEGKVKFLGGTIFSAAIEAGCARNLHFFAHATDTTAACTAPKPCPKKDVVGGAPALDLQCTEEPEPVPPTEPTTPTTPPPPPTTPTTEPTTEPTPVPATPTPVPTTPVPTST